MEKIIEIPDGYEARIEGNKVVLEPKESEDERIKKELVKYFINSGCNYIRGVPIENVIAYLEKQKEQKPAEWSEEDEERLDSIIESYKTLCKEYKNCYDVDFIPFDSNDVVRTIRGDVKFLKSLRPRTHWKPTEEQMEWLEQAVRLSANKLRTHDIILSLYNDLKKLM